jgi:hypothetical protein
VSRGYDVVLDHLPVRLVPLAGVCLQLLLRQGQRFGSAMLVLDAVRDEIVRLPSDPFDQVDLLSLAHDGRRLLVRGRTDRDGNGLRLYPEASGQHQSFDEGPDGPDIVAALSPDGRHIATLCVAADPAASWIDAPGCAVVSLIDTSTGHRRRVWSGAMDGAWSAESTVSWSPDSNLIAVTYLQWMTGRDDRTDDYWWATAVVDPAGTLVRHVDGAIPPSNGAWRGDRELLIDDEGSGLPPAVLDVHTGTRRAVTQPDGIPFAVIGDYAVVPDQHARGDMTGLMLCELWGNGRQPFMTVRTPGTVATIVQFDVAPSATPHLLTNMATTADT